MKRFLASLFLLLFSFGPSRASWNDPAWDIPNDEELQRVVSQLNDSSTEMEALRKLIKYASHFLYEGGSMLWTTGNQQADTRKREAVKSITAARNPELVARALQHEDRDVRFWATMSIPADFHKDNPWNGFAPHLQKLAAEDPDAAIRSQAISKLLHCAGGPALVAELREANKETDPGVLMRLLRFNSGEAALRSQWYAKAVKHLEGKDAALRILWLNVVAGNTCNPSTADMWRIEADPALVETLQDIEHTGTEEERKLATHALKALTAGYRWGQKKEK